LRDDDLGTDFGAVLLGLAALAAARLAAACFASFVDAVDVMLAVRIF
jgi:hypothetical protein